jgi:dihydroflavonol-4-reductase
MIAVTGATGHIGNVLVRQLLSRGEIVRAVVNPSRDTIPLNGLKVELCEADIRYIDPLIQAFKGSDAVYHLAAKISILPGKSELLHQVNVVGTRNVVEACLRGGVPRLVYTSSIHAIKEPPCGTVIDENCSYEPESVPGGYSECKAQATLEVMRGVEQGLNAVILCPTGVIGPYDYRISEMGQLILNFMTGKLKAYVAGAYDFVDVRDVAIGLILACEKGRSGESYLLSGEQITVPNLLLMLEEITGEKAPSFKIPVWLARTVGKVAPLYARLTKTKPLFTTYSIDVLASNSWVSSEKARRELGFSSRPVRDSITDAVQWFKESGYTASSLRRQIKDFS